MTRPPAIVAIDPGREKCGLAVRISGETIARTIVPTTKLPQVLADVLAEHPQAVIVLGDGTGSSQVRRLLDDAGVTDQALVALVDEHRSSEEGRRRYLQEHPGRGLARLLPHSLRVPPEPFDDYVAEVLAERYEAKHS